MVVRPDSPDTMPEEDWYNEYVWMNEQDNFEEEYMDALHLEELNKVAQQIDDELLETELTQDINGMSVTNENNMNSQQSNDNAQQNNQNTEPDILVRSAIQVNNSRLNPNAVEFVPSSSPSR